MLNLINKEQQTTVRIIDQPLIINAGPGTGKTKTLVAKILYLINGKHYKPSSILALTFTKKAAEEIHARIRDGAKSQDLKGIFTGTFHAFGLKVLEEFDNGQNKEIKIVENAEQKKIIKKIASEKDVKETALLISNYKNSNYTNQTDKQSEIKQLVDMYNQELKKQGLIDYDDLLLNTLTLIRQSKNVKEALQNRFKYILIDEFQDTNKIQYEILRELVTKDGKAGIAGTAEIGICVIGDPLQSIYGFRGARGGVFDDFKKDFPGSKEVTLEINYRSTKEIIKTSHRLFPESIELAAAFEKTGTVEHVNTMNEYSEADWIISKISQIIGGTDLIQSSDFVANDQKNDKHATFADFAVIYRTHGFSRVLEKKFREQAIPFQIVGGKSIYERPEIELIINVLKYLHGDKDKDKEAEIPEVNLFSKWKEKNDLVAIAGDVINVCKLEEKLENKSDRLIDLNSFQADLLRFEKYKDPIGAFLENLEKLEERDYYDEKSDKVTLLTMHAAKGLEFKYVFICGFEEGLIPFIKKVQSTREISINNAQLEEEKRLLYVAMTRAKQGLYLISAKERNRKRNMRPSRFLKLLEGESFKEVQDEAIKKVQKRREVKKAKKAQIGMF